MKKIFITSLLLFSFLGVRTSGMAHSSTNLSDAKTNTILTQQPKINKEQKESNVSKDPQIGYRWRCKGCEKVGHWQLFYSIASKHAQAHSMNKNHLTYVYGV